MFEFRESSFFAASSKPEVPDEAVLEPVLGGPSEWLAMLSAVGALAMLAGDTSFLTYGATAVALSITVDQFLLNKKKELLAQTEKDKADRQRAKLEEVADLLESAKNRPGLDKITPPAHFSHDEKDLSEKPADYTYLWVVLGVAAIGSATIPYFAFGLAVGAVDVLLKCAIMRLLNAVGIIKYVKDDVKTKKYSDDIKVDPLSAIIDAPLIEELIFRAGLQPLLMFGLIALSPALAVTSFYATGLSVAAAAAIFLTAIIFGALHVTSSEDNDDYLHAFMATLGGIIFGVLALQFGLMASIAAHFMVNSIAVTLLIFEDSLKKTDDKISENISSASNPDEQSSVDDEVYFAPGSYLFDVELDVPSPSPAF